MEGDVELGSQIDFNSITASLTAYTDVAYIKYDTLLLVN